MKEFSISKFIWGTIVFFTIGCSSIYSQNTLNEQIVLRLKKSDDILPDGLREPFRFNKLNDKDKLNDGYNLCMYQLPEGMLFIANDKVLQQYDGISIKNIIPEHFRKIITSDDNQLWGSGYKTLGKISPDSLGRAELQRYLPLKLADSLNAIFLRYMAAADDGIWACSNNTLFHWDGKVLTHSSYKESLAFLTAIDGKVYFQVSGKGLFTVSKNDTVLLQNSAELNDIAGRQLYKYGTDDFVLVTASSGLIRYREGSFTAIANNTDAFFKDNRIFGVVRLQSGELLLWSEKKGVLICDENGQYLTHIDKNNGLSSDIVYSCFEDAQNNIWIFSPPDAFIVRNPLKNKLVGAKNGLKGHIITTLLHNDTLYTGTNSGVFKVAWNKIGIEKFEEVSPELLQFTPALNVLDGEVLGGNYSEVNVSGKKNKKVIADRKEQLGQILKHPFLQNHYLVATDNGVFLWKKINENQPWVMVKKLPENNLFTMYMSIDSRGFLYHRDFRTDLRTENLHTEKYILQGQYPEEENPISIKIGNKLYVVLQKVNEVKLVNLNTGELTTDTTLLRLSVPCPNFAFGLYKAPNNSILILNTEGDTILPHKGKYWSMQLFNMHSEKFILPISGGIAIAYNSTELEYYDNSKPDMADEKFKAYITGIFLNTDSLLFAGMKTASGTFPSCSNNPSVPYIANSLLFNFSAPFIATSAMNTYSYKLDGFDKEWSDFTEDHQKEYTNLNEGDYVFRVKAKDGWGRISEEDVFAFSIMPPWYRTIWAYLLYLVVAVLFVIGVVRFNSKRLREANIKLEGIVAKRTEEIREERDKSDALLLNILPSEVAAELKEKGYADAKQFDEVTVLFTDFKGFTAIAEKLSAQDLVKEINECFSAFDKICENHGIEKIKTIGDAYMAAGGLPVANSTHAHDVVKAGLEMRDYLLKRAATQTNSEAVFQIRIGIHTGPVVAGIVGIKKFQYDIWGDTVNTASRMESSGEAGKVNISETTYQLVKDKFTCEYRGEIEAKGKGKVKMYFVN